MCLIFNEVWFSEPLQYYSRLLVLWVLPGLPLSPFWCLLQCGNVLPWAAQCCWVTFCRGGGQALLGLGLLLSLGGRQGDIRLHSCYE